MKLYPNVGGGAAKDYAQRVAAMLKEIQDRMPEENKRWWHKGQTLETFAEWGIFEEP